MTSVRPSGVLTQAEVDEFWSEGFLLVEGLLDPQEVLDPLARAYERRLDDLASELHASGRIRSTYAHLGFSDRFIRIEGETNETNAQYFDFSLPQTGITGDTPMFLDEVVFETLTNERLLDLAESIIGGEIASTPVQHIRIKSPERLGAHDPVTGATKMGATNWHQDNGVVLPVADETEMLTVWFSLSEAREEHGCLQVLPRSHRAGLLTHCPAGPGGLEVPPALADRRAAVPLPTRRGDVLLLHRRTVHSSLVNISDEIRWSLDLRYHPIGKPTGREVFPGFVARSRRHPDRALRDHRAWADSWYRARHDLAAANFAGPFHRWSPEDPACA